MKFLDGIIGRIAPANLQRVFFMIMVGVGMYFQNATLVDLGQKGISRTEVTHYYKTEKEKPKAVAKPVAEKHPKKGEEIKVKWYPFKNLIERRERKVKKTSHFFQRGNVSDFAENRNFCSDHCQDFIWHC